MSDAGEPSVATSHHPSNMEHRTCAIILARAGSKGLPGKNAAMVAGKPMLAWTIEHALAATRIDRVALSTDGAAMADIGRSYGLDIVERPADLAGDAATVDSAARHAVSALEKGVGSLLSCVVILYGNVPVRPADLADRALAKLIDTGCDSVQSVCGVGKMHPYWMRRLSGESGDVLTQYEPNQVYRRQDLPSVYMLDGGVIAVTRDSLFTVRDGQPHAFLGRDRRAIVTRPGEVVDVDSEIDLRVAEATLEKARC